MNNVELIKLALEVAESIKKGERNSRFQVLLRNSDNPKNRFIAYKIAKIARDHLNGNLAIYYTRPDKQGDLLIGDKGSRWHVHPHTDGSHHIRQNDEDAKPGRTMYAFVGPDSKQQKYTHYTTKCGRQLGTYHTTIEQSEKLHFAGKTMYTLTHPMPNASVDFNFQDLAKATLNKQLLDDILNRVSDPTHAATGPKDATAAAAAASAPEDAASVDVDDADLSALASPAEAQAVAKPVIHSYSGDKSRTDDRPKADTAEAATPEAAASGAAAPGAAAPGA